jgi:hypothetical protein
MGLAIANESQDAATHLKVIDPEPRPLISLGVNEQEQAKRVAEKLTVARAVGILGLSDVAIELSFPEELDVELASTFMTRSERVRTQRTRKERVGAAQEQLRLAPLEQFTENGRTFRGREALFDIPGGLGELSGAKIHVRQGVSSQALEALEAVITGEGLIGETSDGVDIQSDKNHVSLSCGKVFYSDLTISRRR